MDWWLRPSFIWSNRPNSLRYSICPWHCWTCTTNSSAAAPGILGSCEAGTRRARLRISWSFGARIRTAARKRFLFMAKIVAGGVGQRRGNPLKYGQESLRVVKVSNRTGYRISLRFFALKIEKWALTKVLFDRRWRILYEWPDQLNKRGSTLYYP